MQLDGMREVNSDVIQSHLINYQSIFDSKLLDMKFKSIRYCQISTEPT